MSKELWTVNAVNGNVIGTKYAAGIRVNRLQLTPERDDFIQLDLEDAIILNSLLDQWIKEETSRRKNK